MKNGKTNAPGLRSAACACLAAAMLSASAPVHASIPIQIQGLGSNSFEVDPSSSTAAYWQTADTLNLPNSSTLGDTLGGAFGSLSSPVSLDLLSYPSFGLEVQLSSGSGFNTPFTVEFFDASFQLLNKFTGTTTTASTNRSVLWLSFADTTVASFATVAGLQFTWDGDQSGTSSYTALRALVGAKPEGYYTARSPGGFRFLTWTNAGSGLWLPPGKTSWAALSDSNAKTGVTAMDHRETLRKVSKLPVTSWQYKHDPNHRYIGPMAQDFYAAFGLGSDDKHISTLDADGVALSALKGLIAELRQRQVRSQAQARRLAELEAELQVLRATAPNNLPPAE